MTVITPTTETGIVEVTLDMVRAGQTEFTRRFAEQCRGAHPSTAVCEAASIAIYGAMVRAAPHAAMPDSTQLLQTVAGALETCLAMGERELKRSMNLNGDSPYDIGIAALAQFRAQEQRS